MKSTLRLILVVALLLAAAPAVAGKGGPTVEGFWGGAGHAIYPDGTIVEIVEVEASLLQDGYFFFGEASFTVILGDSDQVTQDAQMSGHIKGNALTGLGSEMTGGSITLHGNTDDAAGRGMMGGEITINGNVGNAAGIGMKDGSIWIKGNAGKNVGASMSGGRIDIGGNYEDIARDFPPGCVFHKGRPVIPQSL